MPVKSVPTLDAMDVVVGLSESIRCAFQFTLSGPLIIGGLLPLQLPQGIKGDREHFGLPDDAKKTLMQLLNTDDPS